MADTPATAVWGTSLMQIVIILGNIKPSFSSFVRLEGN